MDRPSPGEGAKQAKRRAAAPSTRRDFMKSVVLLPDLICCFPHTLLSLVKANHRLRNYHRLFPFQIPFFTTRTNPNRNCRERSRLFVERAASSPPPAACSPPPAASRCLSSPLFVMVLWVPNVDNPAPLLPEPTVDDHRVPYSDRLDAKRRHRAVRPIRQEVGPLKCEKNVRWADAEKKVHI